jgi:hypothetical protein
MTDALVTIEGLTKRYSGVAAIDNLTTVINAGQVTGLVGPGRRGEDDPHAPDGGSPRLPVDLSACAALT